MIEQLCKLPLDCKLMIPRKKADVLSLSEFCVIVYVLVNVLAEFCALLMVAYLREPYLYLQVLLRGDFCSNAIINRTKP